jgi:uncharacterized protein (DUF2147 family)
MKNTAIIYLVILLVLIPYFTYSQSITGIWKTIDDETGIDKSHVELYIKNEKLYGKIVKILDTSEGENPLCTECSGEKKNQPILGMEIISGLKERRKDWYLDKGIFDPETGKTYDCKIWLDGKNTLKVRGYIGILYRTQTWYRIK